MKRLLFLFLLSLLLIAAVPAQAAVATFDDFALTVPPATNYTGPGGGQYYNGFDGAGGFTSGGANFVNNYNSGWGSWDGWSVSNTTDTTTAGFTNQYSAITGGAYSGTQYGVFYETFGDLAPTINFSGPTTVLDTWITNTTYAYLAVVNGNDGNTPSYVKGSFGAGDWFKVTVWGYDNLGQQTNSLDIYLADYRDASSSNWYALDTWTQFDMSSLGTGYGLGFDLSSTDNGAWGMNTPAYFAMDDLNAVPIPGSVLLLGSGLLGILGLRRRQSCRMDLK